MITFPAHASTFRSTASRTQAPAVAISRRPAGAPSDVWEGVGAHSNPVVYTPKPGVAATSPEAIARGEQQIANLHPQVTRVRVDPAILSLQDASWVAANPAAADAARAQLGQLQHLSGLAAQHGGRVDLCLWNLPRGYRTTPAQLLQLTDRFATLVKGLAGSQPGSFIVSAQNEPNRTKLTPQQLVSLYQDLDRSLRSTLGPQGRAKVQVIAGDLTYSDQSAEWIAAVVPKLAPVVDGFSFHVYAHDGEAAASVEQRLRQLRREVDAAMPPGHAAPQLLLTEYGVRGSKLGAQATEDRPGDVVLPDGSRVPLRDSPVGAFREAQLVLAAARAGFSGAARWGANPGGGTPWESWSMTGAEAEGFVKKPAYFVTQLFTATIGAGWRAVQTHGAVAGESIATFRAPNGQGAAAVAANSKSTAQPLAVGGFVPGAAVQLLVWNKTGTGKLASFPAVADARGVVQLLVPPGGVASASTLLARPQ